LGCDRHVPAGQQRDAGIARFERGESATQPAFYHNCYERDSKALWAQTPSIEVVAVLWDGDAALRSFASERTVWDFTRRTHRLVMVAVGCFSESGPRNPNLPDPLPIRTRLENHNWVHGIN
jgi:hypothetical protein